MSEVKVNKLSPRSGTTVTLGDSGDTFAITSGASISGFTSTGIDDNATSTAITIDSSERVGIGATSLTYLLSLEKSNAPNISFKDTSGGTDAKTWLMQGLDSDFRLQTRNDADNGGQVASIITRSGATVQTHQFYTEDSERMRLTTTGLGIGTSSISTKLEVVGTGVNGIELGQQSDGNDSSRLFFTNSSNVCAIRSTGGNLKFSTGATINSSSGDDRVTITSAGKVGIATATPNNFNASANQLVVGSGSGDNGITIFAGTSNNSSLFLADGTVGTNGYRGSINYLHNGDALTLHANATETMRLSNGKVGIGTSSPQAITEIVGGTGDIKVLRLRTGDSTAANNSGIDFNVLSSATQGNRNAVITLDADGANAIGSDYFQFIKTGGSNQKIFFPSNDLIFEGSSEHMRINSSGNVGIGETAPLGLLHVKTADTGAGSVSGNANELVIENTGNVGITLQSDNSGTGNLYFGDVANGSVGRISYSHADNSMRFNVNGSQVLFIKDDGKIGTGGSGGTLEIEGGATYPGGRIALSGGVASTDPGTIKFFTDDGTDTNPAERMRIDSSGNVLIGKTTTATTTNGVNINSSGTYLIARPAGGSAAVFYYTVSGASVGKIQINSSSTSYVTTSDYRTKENVSYDFDATSRLKQLKPARFNFIADADTTVDGFLAHEVSDIVPEAITGEKDAMKTEEYEVTPAVLDEDGNVITEAVMGTREVPDYQGIDQSKLVPLLVKTIQELEARITTLENA